MKRYALRDDQWERIEELLPGRKGHVGVTQQKITDCLLKRYFIVIELVYRREICPTALGIGESYTHALAVGLRQVYGNVFLAN